MKKRSISFSTKILLQIVSIVIIMFSISASASYLKAKDTLVNNIHDNLTSRTADSSSAIEREFSF